MASRCTIVLALVLVVLAGQACETRGLSSMAVTKIQKARSVMVLRVRLGDGFRNDTVSVLVNGAQVFHKSGVSTNLAISRADSFEVGTDGGVLRVEVAVQGGPRAFQEIDPARTPFVEVRRTAGALQLLALEAEPPMM